MMKAKAVSQKKVAVVTGGSRGIGRAICLAFAARGMRVVVNYAGNAFAARETVAACQALGAEAVAVQGDVSEEKACEALFAAAVQAFGRVDILVNNAGVTKDTLILRMCEADFDRVLDTNLKGAFFCMKQAARLMMKQRSGRIINISSVVGLRGNVGQVNYAASKAGLIGMTKALAKELAPRGVTVNAVAPGFIETDMTDQLSAAVRERLLAGIPMQSLGRTEDVAAAVSFFAEDAAGYITGQVLCVDGGMAM